MSYGHPQIEHEIAARSLAIAMALLSHNQVSPEVAQKLRQGGLEDAGDLRLPPDTATFFALERVATHAKVPVLRLKEVSEAIPAGALVMIDAHLPAPLPQAPVLQALRSALLVVAPTAWGPALQAAALAHVMVDPGPAPEPSGRRPSPR